MQDRENRVKMLNCFAKILETNSLDQIIGAIILSNIYLGCNCAGFTAKELEPLNEVIENRLNYLRRSHDV